MFRPSYTRRRRSSSSGHHDNPDGDSSTVSPQEFGELISALGSTGCSVLGSGRSSTKLVHFSDFISAAVDANNEWEDAHRDHDDVSTAVDVTIIEEVPNRADMTADEIQALWYTPSDLDKIGQSNLIETEMMKNSVPERDAHYSYRGLETASQERRRMRKNQRSVKAVIHEQQKLLSEQNLHHRHHHGTTHHHRSNRFGMEHQLSRAYQEHAYVCRWDGRERAKEDEKQAHKIMKHDPNLLFLLDRVPSSNNSLRKEKEIHPLLTLPTSMQGGASMNSLWRTKGIKTTSVKAPLLVKTKKSVCRAGGPPVTSPKKPNGGGIPESITFSRGGIAASRFKTLCRRSSC